MSLSLFKSSAVSQNKIYQFYFNATTKNFLFCWTIKKSWQCNLYFFGHTELKNLVIQRWCSSAISESLPSTYTHSTSGLHVYQNEYYNSCNMERVSECIICCIIMYDNEVYRYMAWSVSYEILKYVDQIWLHESYHDVFKSDQTNKHELKMETLDFLYSLNTHTATYFSIKQLFSKRFSVYIFYCGVPLDP